jgi:hypothetical protein
MLYVIASAEEDARRRLRQMVYLEHYGSSTIAAWAERSVWDLDNAYEEMNRLIRMENGETVPD